MLQGLLKLVCLLGFFDDFYVVFKMLQTHVFVINFDFVKIGGVTVQSAAN
jgi:hypothetical protein